MKILRHLLSALIVVSALAAPIEAYSQVTLLTNLPSNDGGGGGVTSSEQRAVTFTTFASSFLVLEVQMRFVNYESSTDFAELSIHLDGGNKPGSQVGNAFTAPSSISNSAANFTFTSDGVQLNPNTKYWVVIKGGSGSGLFTWNRSDPTKTPVSTAYAVFDDQWISQNSGSTWSSGSNGAHSFAIVGVPESTVTAGIFGIAVIGMLLLRKSRQHNLKLGLLRRVLRVRE